MFAITRPQYSRSLFGSSIFDDLLGPDTRALGPATTVRETDSGFEIQIDLPGLDPKDLQVEIENQVLTITAPRPGRSHFARSWKMPEGTDLNAISAKLDLGVLRVGIPKLEAAKPRRIEVQVTSSMTEA